jgi:hypothetical protein
MQRGCRGHYAFHLNESMLKIARRTRRRYCALTFALKKLNYGRAGWPVRNTAIGTGPRPKRMGRQSVAARDYPPNSIQESFLR